jgi:hypothetical protein
MIVAIAAIVIIAVLCHFHISFTAKILGFTLVAEVLVLLAVRSRWWSRAAVRTA